MTIYTSPQDGSEPHASIRGLAGYTTTNYSSSSNGYTVGERNDNVGDYRRSLTKFPGLTNGDVPASATVSAVSIFLKISYDFSSNARTLRVYRNKRDVVFSEVTWIRYKVGSDWASAGGFGANDCEQTDIGSVNLSATESVNTWVEIPLDPASIQEIIDGTWTTPTLFLKMDTESNDNYSFYGPEDATPENRPYIVVNYTLSSSSIKTAANVAYALLKTVAGVVIASAKKIAGVQ